MKILHYLKSLLWSLLFIVLSSFIITVLYYFRLLNSDVLNVLYLVVPILGIIIGSFLLGRSCKEKGWLEGLKFGGIYLVLMTIISFLIFRNGFVMKVLLYDVILLLSAMLGSMIGISFKHAH